ncbi:E3 ubiquitin-protein ligase TRIM71-like [Anneissia japonica]|uniref:E3 ubiquitin-protein ligase TRIM71-like n=1 Tax=Anneissia japonica TaxID=1529436 RepID=UPI0014257EB0|nr:E3 ubiquitin-protein ligase TRIM71-like [Anneissia japonica]XP_033119003.1 E3 ubiquitin-protein ligase TRIM71-like [Anneissia japonica]
MSRSLSKPLQFIDKMDVECAICLNRFHQPKTLKCMHTYCLQCIQKWGETHGKMKCPTCAQEHDLTKDDLKDLASNTTISQLLEYVTKTEDQKPTKCSCCDINQPVYHCQTCQLYLCEGLCIKQHQIIPALRNHSLYILDKKEQDGSSDEHTRSEVCYTALKFFCSTCNKACQHFLHCYQKQHKVIPMSTAISEFNNNATEIVKLAHEIENKLSEKLEFVIKDSSEFDLQLKLCRTAIEIQEKKLIKTVTEKRKELMSHLVEMYKEKKEDTDSKVQDIDSKMTQIIDVITSVNTIMNKPEETETLQLHSTTINAVRDKVLGKDFDQPFKNQKNTPNFIPTTQLDDLMVAEGIGIITTVDSTCQAAKDDEEITGTKEQPFVVKVLSPTGSDDCQLPVILINSSGKKSATNVEYQGNGEYKITGRCNTSTEGDWETKITVGKAHGRGSPVKFKGNTEQINQVFNPGFGNFTQAMPPQQRPIYPTQITNPRWTSAYQQRPLIGHQHASFIPPAQGTIPSPVQPFQPIPPVSLQHHVNYANAGNQSVVSQSAGMTVNQMSPRYTPGWRPQGWESKPQPMHQQVPGHEPLTISNLAQATPKERKRMIGERLYRIIELSHEELAGKITGMLLELDNIDLLHMLESRDSLSAMIDEAAIVLKDYKAKKSGNKSTVAASVQ